MSESTSTPEPATRPIDTSASPAPASVTPAVVETRDPDERRRRPTLNVVAAWVGIVAGVVFIVAVIFGTGFVLGASTGGGDHHGGRHHHGGGGQMHHERGPGGPEPAPPTR